MMEYIDQLKTKRKMALRFGKLADTQAQYEIKPDAMKKVLNGSKSLSGLTECVVQLKNRPKYHQLINEKSADGIFTISRKPAFYLMKWPVFHLE